MTVTFDEIYHGKFMWNVCGRVLLGRGIEAMDKNAIKTLKTHYTLDIVSQPNTDISSLLRNFTIKDAIINVAFAWHK